MVPATLAPVTVSYSDLVSAPQTLLHDLRRAFGSDEGCLGIILIRDLPAGFAALREKLFDLAYCLANLPEHVREGLSRPQASYSFGWSHGKEVMNGRPDLQKGSYYANPLLDYPDVSEEKRAQYPEYYSGNVWPNGIERLDEFEPTFKALGKIIFDIGCTLARACEPFVPCSSELQSLESLIASSMSNKARLLHYYPQPSADFTDIANDALCGTHVDHSLLTGLCSAIYLSGRGDEGSPVAILPPDSSAGLYIYPRSPADSPKPKALKVQIPPDCLAFQMGEALELLTDGKLAATPHFVSGGTGPDVSRETFAFFLQPDVDDVVSSSGETFGHFTKRVLSRHYT